MNNPHQVWLVIACLALGGCALAEAPKLLPVSNALPPLPPETYDISQVTVLPHAIYQAAPHYPRELRQRGIGGTSEILFTVATDGSVRDVSVLSATDSRFGDAGAEAVRKWTFQPAKVDGHVVNCRMQVPVSFEISSD